MTLRRIISAVTAMSIALLSTVASASVLGSEVLYTATERFGEGTYFTKNIFFSDQDSVGKQTEYYFEYTPNEKVVPAIVNGAALYGKRPISDMAKQMENDGRFPMMLLNADFFSLETGVPMSDCVMDGEVITKGGVGTDAIGINQDGTAFMSWLHLYTTIKVEETEVQANLVNKYRQPYSLYLLTDKFGEETYAKGKGTNVIIGELDGDLKVGTAITGVVESVIKTDGSIKIPKGKLVLTLDDRADQERQNEIALFQEGQKVTLTSSAQGDERWNNAKYILGATGGRIIADGKITDVDQSAAPRSAVGITSSGKLIFYAIDGRLTGHSYGARLQTLASRLKELGCINAINLDGGGSTSITGIFPGYMNSTLINKPSDGQERGVSNFLALINTQEATGELAHLTTYPFTGYYLKGAIQEVNVLGTDENGYPV
ncbi:MAG: phosphodiester glycosidase family protein, partial [Eubacteriales bacterium]|nr:phosphodiester glycosidase family protein [Eubacteriales bacterium]